MRTPLLFGSRPSSRSTSPALVPRPSCVGPAPAAGPARQPSRLPPEPLMSGPHASAGRGHPLPPASHREPPQSPDPSLCAPHEVRQPIKGLAPAYRASLLTLGGAAATSRSLAVPAAIAAAFKLRATIDLLGCRAPDNKDYPRASLCGKESADALLVPISLSVVRNDLAGVVRPSSRPAVRCRHRPSTAATSPCVESARPSRPRPYSRLGLPCPAAQIR